MTQVCLLSAKSGSPKQTPNENAKKIKKMSLNPEPIYAFPFEIIYDRVISTSIMHPLEGNVNTVDRPTQQAIGESIKIFGLLQQFVVEPHPKIPDEYRILGGNHRYLEIQGETRCNIIIGLNESQARKLSLALNTHGKLDPEMMLIELSNIYEAQGIETAIGLPFTPDEIEAMMSAPLPPLGDEEDMWRKITLSIPEDVYQIIMQAVEKTGITHKNSSIRLVKAIELICVEYINDRYATTIENSA